MLTRQEIKSKTSDELRKYITDIIKPTIKIWQNERKRIDGVIRNR